MPVGLFRRFQHDCMLKAERFRRDGRSTSAQMQDRQSRAVSPRVARGVQPARFYDLFPPRRVSSLSQSGFETRGLSSLIWRGRRGERCLCPIRLLIIPDETRAALSGQEQPGPLQEDADPKTELSQISGVNESPRQPREKAMDVHFAAFQDGPPFADHSHVAFVEIAKRFRTFLSGGAATN